MKTLLLLLSCVALASSSFAQTAGQFELRRFNSGGGMTSFWVTPENSKAFGLNGSGVPAMIAVGGSSTLAGLSDVAMSSLANIDLLRYDLASGKWVNATIASLGLVTTGDLSGYLTTSAASSAYQPLAEALTTLSSATAAGLALMDDANAAAQRTTLGLGTAATATIATAVTNNAVPTIHNAAGSPDRGITGISSTGKIVFSTPTGTGSPVWAVSPSLQGSPTIGAGSGSFSSLKFYDSNGGTGDNYIGLRAPNDVTSDMTFILPATDGTSGQALTTNGSGTLSFATVGVSDGDYGSVTVGGSGTTITIDSGAVTDSMLAGSISPSKVTGTAAILGTNTFNGVQTINAATTPLTVQSGGINAATITTTAASGSLWVGHPDYFSFETSGGAIIGNYASGERSRLAFGENVWNLQARGGNTGNTGLYVTNLNYSAAYLAGDIRLTTTVGVFLIEPLKRDTMGAYTGPGHTVRLKGGDGQSASTGAAGGDAEIRGGDAGGSGNNNGGAVKFIGGVATGGGATGSPMQLTEQTAPPVPPANGVNIWIEDNGSGKTVLKAQFATGSAQQIAIEP